MTKKKKIKKRDELRKKLNDALRDEIITRTEYNLIWDLTTELNIYLAEIYFKQAFADNKG